MMRWILTLLGLSLSTATANPLLDHEKLALLVPAYFYPGLDDRHWPALASAARRVPVTVIVNPASGPGDAADPAYVEAVRQIRAAGAKAIAYVHISYGKRPIALVKADLDRYRSFYELDGVFIDETVSDNEPETVRYQTGLIQQIRKESPQWTIVANPGVRPHPVHLGEQGADMVVSFENTGEQWLLTHHSPEATAAVTTDPPVAELAHLVHSTPDAQTMHKILSSAVTTGVQAIYITDDLMDNPWDTLPSWWNSLLHHVEAINSGA